MIIVNPIYDVAFKRMMEDNEVATFFIASLLQENVVSLESKQHECFYKDQPADLPVVCLYFFARIHKENRRKSVSWVKIIKARTIPDCDRFMRYLCDLYNRNIALLDAETEGHPNTVLLLECEEPDIKSAYARFEWRYKEGDVYVPSSVPGTLLEVLPGKCVVQIGKIIERSDSELSKMLSVLEQARFADKKKIVKEYRLSPDTAGPKKITGDLHQASAIVDRLRSQEIPHPAPAVPTKTEKGGAKPQRAFFKLSL